MATKQSGKVGRPRGFDADEALDRAMRVFWEHGYEGASLSCLTEAMGISTTSMYSAFGNKEELFRKVLERYTAGPGAYLNRALDEPTAREVAAAILDGAIRATTCPTNPAGCLGVQSALSVGDSGREVRDLLADWRNNGCSRVHERFRQAVDTGDLPAGTDPGLLARYVTTLVFGISVQAASGATRDELQEMADAAMRSWPIH
ncbi:TetR/AcrR family transcriptional regulator [Rhodococcus sp. NPDC047139]|uniref:TetR/AcrR family transcriptional regulator n=1 Tax=Rhodococcus sp. NPDC047139 TaxID=3155141 RepID=UPI0033E898C8